MRTPAHALCLSQKASHAKQLYSVQYTPAAFFRQRLSQDSFMKAEVSFRFSISIIPSAAAANCSGSQTQNIIHTNAETKAAIGQEKLDELLFAMSFLSLNKLKEHLKRGQQRKLGHELL